MAAIPSSPSNLSTPMEPLVSSEDLAAKRLAESNAIIATSTFFHCEKCGKVNLINSTSCDITVKSKDQSFSLSWSGKSIDWLVEKGPFRVIFYLNGSVEVLKEHPSVTLDSPSWLGRLIRMVGKNEFSQLKKIAIPCEQVFCFKPTLDMVKDGPVILISCKGSVFALGARGRADPNSPPAILTVFLKEERWYWAWHFTAAAGAPAKEDGRHYLLNAKDWPLISKLLEDTHPVLVRLPQIKVVTHDSTGES